MVVPKITTETWVRVMYWTHTCVGNETDTSDFSFEQRIKTLLDWEPYERIDKMDNGDDWYLKDFPQGETFEVPPSTDNKHHRPEVSEETAQRLHEWVDATGMAPVEAYDFEDKVKSLLSAMDKYGKKVNVEVKQV